MDLVSATTVKRLQFDLLPEALDIILVMPGSERLRDVNIKDVYAMPADKLIRTLRQLQTLCFLCGGVDPSTQNSSARSGVS